MYEDALKNKGFVFLTGDTQPQHYGGWWIQEKPQHNGEWHWWLLVNTVGDRNLEDAGAPLARGKYHTSFVVASPEAAGLGHICEAYHRLYNDDPVYVEAAINEGRGYQFLVELLTEHGIFTSSAPHVSMDFLAGLHHVADAAERATMLFGFFMDQRINALGNTQWDAVRGNLGFKKHRFRSCAKIIQNPKTVKLLRLLLGRLQRRSSEIRGRNL